MTILAVAIAALQLGFTDPQAQEATAADSPLAAAEATIPTQAELEAQAARQAATDASAPSEPDAFEAFLRFAEGEAPQGFDACIPAQNADAHLSRVTRQVRLALDLLDAEMQSQQASPRVRAAYNTLVQDTEMTMAQYMVQVLIEETC